MDKKRLLIAIIFTLVCIGIGYLLYRVFFYKEKPPEQPIKIMPKEFQFPQAGKGAKPGGAEGGPTELPAAGQLPVAGLGQEIQPPTIEKKMVDTLVGNPTSDINSGARYYDKINGKFYHLDNNGNLQELSDKVFYNVQKVIWSPIKDQAILEYPDNSKIIYDFTTKKQVSLPKHWENFSFSPLGEKVAAKSIALAPENRWLITFDTDGKNISRVEPMGENADKVSVDWSPNKQIIATSLTGEELGDDRQEVLFVGQHHENFKSTIVEGRDLRSSWSPEGKRLLYSVHNARNNYQPELWIVNAESDSIGSNRQILGLNTWADKCNFAGERFVYCAVPTQLDIGAGFAPQTADYTPDEIYRIDLQTNLKTKIPVNGSYTVNQLFTSKDNKTLYFTDKNQSGLFSVPL